MMKIGHRSRYYPLLRKCLERGIPTRLVDVPAYGKIQVPRWLTRFDYEYWGTQKSPNGKRVPRWRTNHGWMLRYDRLGPKSYWFKDGTSADPVRSLVAAIEYLLDVYVGPADRHAKREKVNKKFPTGHPGVRLVMIPKKGRKVTQWYAEMVRLPGIKNTPRRFYIGTEKTATQERAEEAVRRAQELRSRLLNEERP
jgi:hypothetical protein